MKKSSARLTAYLPTNLWISKIASLDLHFWCMGPWICLPVSHTNILFLAQDFSLSRKTCEGTGFNSFVFQALIHWPATSNEVVFWPHHRCALSSYWWTQMERCSRTCFECLATLFVGNEPCKKAWTMIFWVEVTWPTKFPKFFETGSWPTTKEIFQNSRCPTRAVYEPTQLDRQNFSEFFETGS